MKAPTLLAVARHRGTEISNPVSSSEESANFRSLSSGRSECRVKTSAPCLPLGEHHARQYQEQLARHPPGVAAKHLPRYLGAFAWLFNRRFVLKTIHERLAIAATTTPPTPYLLLKLAEARW